MALQICYLRVDESGFLPTFRCTNMISIPQSQTFGLVYVFNFFCVGLGLCLNLNL